jgi:hypothetical protein
MEIGPGNKISIYSRQFKIAEIIKESAVKTMEL